MGERQREEETGTESGRERVYVRERVGGGVYVKEVGRESMPECVCVCVCARVCAFCYCVFARDYEVHMCVYEYLSIPLFFSRDGAGGGGGGGILSSASSSSSSSSSSFSPPPPPPLTFSSLMRCFMFLFLTAFSHFLSFYYRLV